MEQEILHRAMQLQRQAEETEESLKVIDEQIVDLEEFEKGIDFFEKGDVKEMISSLGKGIHARTELKNKKLLVEVGAGVVVQKTPAETREVILNQVKKFKEARVHLLGQLEGYHNEFREMIKEVEGLRENNNS